MGAVCDRAPDTTFETFVAEGATEGSVASDMDKTLLATVQKKESEEPKEKVVEIAEPKPKPVVEEPKPEPKPVVEPKPEAPKPDLAEIPPTSDSKAEPEPTLEAEKPEVEPEVPKKKLVLEFSDQEGKKTTVEFVSRPLGIVYSDKMPDGKMKVKRLSQNSLAGELGVHPGMKFEKIDGKDVSGKRFSEIKALIDIAAEELPTA